MTLPTSPNAISLSQIQTEFGGSSPISLSEYYKGGTYVLSNTDDPYTIPTSGEISFHDFHGATQGSSVTISPATTGIIREGLPAGGACYCNLQYNSDGVEYMNSVTGADNLSLSTRGDWLDSGSSSDVWLERTINSGSLYVDPGSSRLNLGTSRTFKVRDTTNNSVAVTCNLTIDFYDVASGGTPIDSVTFTLSANYGSP